MLIDGEVKSILPVSCKLGEGAFWDSANNCFRFVDIKSHKIFRYDLADEKLHEWSVPEQVGFVFPIKNGKFIAGLKSGLYEFDEQSGEFSEIIRTELEYPNNRLNDGTIGPDGALWFGTMDDGETQKSGAFYRFDGKLSQIDKDISITNGPCFSPCGKTLYTVDTLGKLIFAWDMMDGSPCNKRLFADLNDQKGFADGPVCDSQGNVWIGLFFGWGVRIYAPNGNLLGIINLPVSNITKIAFGGEDLQTVFVTTAKVGLSDDQLAEQPLAGNIFSFRAKIAGYKMPNLLL